MSLLRRLCGVTALVTAVASTGCAVATEHHANLNSTLWYQTSAEFRANSQQNYKLASLQLPALLADKNQSALLSQTSNFQHLPPAVIVDIDETILDNSPTSAQAVLQGETGFNAAAWDRWVLLAKAQAVPGAVEFLNKAQALGVKILYISNRECKPVANCPQREATFRNLQAVGIKQIQLQDIWLKSQQADWSSEKESRRLLAQQQYRVLMLVGDDLGDFLPNVKKNISVSDRFGLVERYQHFWGERWIMLANPTYGSWETILTKPKSSNLTGF